MPLWWRRVRQHFGISAPRMAVRTRLPWWGRGVGVLLLCAVIGGMWWWGFDFGQILGGFNRKDLEAMLRWSFEQGLAPRLGTVEEVFAPGLTEARWDTGHSP